MKGEAVPGQISVLYQRIAPAVDVANGSLPAAIEANVRNQEHLLTRSPLLADLAKGGKLKVVGGVYDLAAGTVKMLSGAA
jgi:carbonic anhydrase